MKRILSAIPFLLLALYSHSQSLSQVSLANASSLSYFSFITDQGILLRVSEDGKLLEWGTELQSERSSNYYAPKLQAYMGRIDYYGNEVDSAYRGKIKSIGTCSFTYYNSLELDDKPGKIKTIGRLVLDYYSRFDNPAFKGKLKTAGTISFDYYSQFEDEGSRGKLKSVGPTKLVYHSKFDDKYIQGKVKSIGSFAYVWGTSLDPKGYGGALKSGQYRQNVNGVIYILR